MSRIIEHIVNLCGYSSGSTMQEIIIQQEWESLSDVTTLSLEDTGDLTLVKDDGSYLAKPLAHHVRKLKAFLLLYKRKGDELSSYLDEDDVIGISKIAFDEYCGSALYHEDMAQGLTPAPKASASNSIQSAELTAAEFRRGTKRDKSHYKSLDHDKYFNVWNRGFVATTFMHHTHQVLDPSYVPTTPTEKSLFKEMQIFMYAVFEEKLNTDKGKSLVSAYESTRDAQAIYKNLLKHAQNSTAALLSGNALLKYITSAVYPGNWRGTSYAFILHWKEQVMQYERLEVEEFPPKQKLRMLQNTVDDVAGLASVKQLSDQVVARGDAPLDFDAYIELLLSACSTYDKSHATTRSGQRNVYSTSIGNHNNIDDN
jgi:hypothetical protein